MSAWIRMLSDQEADENLLDALALSRTPHGTVDNVMRVHSLRPSSLRGHVTLYRAALHDDLNTLPLWLQETVASYVSMLNDCDYSLANHWANARHLIGDFSEEVCEVPMNDPAVITDIDSPGALASFREEAEAT